ncbi:MAG: YfhO family protein [Actinomycetota bacterium]
MVASRRVAASLAGPALIVAGTLFALRGFAFGANITDSHPDILTFWLPRFSFLGRSVAAGHIPLWNPFEMLGYRYAADPQGGWTYLAPMALFSWFPPGAAIRGFIVFNPLLAGLGLYAFLRKETLGALAATAAGLSLVMMMGASEIAVSLPFAGMLAWTPMVLLAAAGYRRTDRWSRRVLWLGLGGLAWSQVANAHMSHGLIMCTLLTVAYLGVGLVLDVREGRCGAGAALGRGILFFAFLPLASLPVLIPRLAFLGTSSLQGGYDALGEPLKRGAEDAPIIPNGVWAGWPLALGVVPGAYAGAAVLLVVPLALRANARRGLVVAFGGALALTWFMMLDAVIGAGWVRSVLLKVPFGDVYLHNPGRMRYVAILAIPVLAAAGIQGLRDVPIPRRRAAPWVAAGVVLWLLLPLAAGGNPLRFAPLAVAMLAAAPLLTLAAANEVRWAPAALAAVLVLDLGAAAVYAQLQHGQTITTGLEGDQRGNLIAQPLPYPDVDLDAFLTPPPFVKTIGDAPYLTWAPPAAYYEKGYLFAQTPQDWPGITMGRGTLFGVRDVLGYNPVQLPRYWDYIRARSPLSIFYNASVIDLPGEYDARLLGLRYLLVPTGLTPPAAGDIVERADGWDLIELRDPTSRVSVEDRWTIAGSEAEAIARVTGGEVDPASGATLETDPGLQMRLSGPSARIEGAITEVTPEDLRIEVDAADPSIVLVRTAFDPGWSATVDGRPAEVLPADGLLMGIPVEAGSHEIQLTYLDPDVTRGLRAGAVVWLGLAVGYLVALTLERRRHRAPERRPAARPRARRRPR